MIFHWLIQRIVKSVVAAHLWLYAFLWKCVLQPCGDGWGIQPWSVCSNTFQWVWRAMCFCGTVTGMFTSAKVCLHSRGADVASCNKKYCCLISCAEVLIGTGLKYAFPNIDVRAQWLWRLLVCLDYVFCFGSCLCWTGCFFYYRIPRDAGKHYLC